MTNKITNRDILKFLHNAQLYSAEPIKTERIDILAAWGAAIIDEMSQWGRDEVKFDMHLNPHELIFVLTSVAYELQDKIMRQENNRCHKKNTRDMKSVLESCLG